MIKLLSALSLAVSVPSFLSGQTPAPPAQPPAPRREVPAPVERRMEVAKVAAARAGMGPMMMRDRMRGMGMGMGMDAASMFLAHTGDLQLTDAQVTKLAAIARRSESREKAMRERMDSSMKRMHAEMSQDGNGMPGAGMMMTMMRAPMMSDAERKAQHEDDREAFSIPTPDQLATAWELMRAHRGW